MITGLLLAAVAFVFVGRKSQADEATERGGRDSEGDDTNKEGNG